MKKYRQAQIKENLQIRAQIIQAVRGFFIEHNYLEVETPCRIPAPAPEAHIDAQNSGSRFLQTSPELCMKQLLSAGYPRIFQICKCFRKKERGRRHLPEFTMLEWYRTAADYLDLMEESEDLIRFVARAVFKRETLMYRGRTILMTKPWERMRVAEAFQKFASLSLEAAISKKQFDETLALEIEPHLGRERPLFLYDYPAYQSALAKPVEGNPFWAQRFELYIGGLELCNAFSELNDAALQRRRFENEQSRRAALKKPSYPTPETFLAALDDMPAAAGNALGIDRLIMLFTGAEQIDDVVAFTPEEL
jgi:lysyl-tRNA synthetase class 2